MMVVMMVSRSDHELTLTNMAEVVKQFRIGDVAGSGLLSGKALNVIFI